MNNHEHYIKRCIELAKNGFGTTYPNPMVGSVIVHDGKIIGEGWHRIAGEAHAEVKAIESVKNKSLLAEATIYVSLEPCNHFGKTPPCCDLILKNKIRNVVIGTMDSHEKVAGSGIEKLKHSGCNVTVGFLEKECQELNKRFFTFHNKKRPYIILKWAESQDGFIAPLSREKQNPVWLSNEYSRQLVHKWRSEEQAILVGTTTVLDDNPRLDVRDWRGQNPTRIVLDKSGKIDNSYHVMDKKMTTIVITERENFVLSEHLINENTIFDYQLAERICAILYKHNIQSVIIEGGTKTLETFIKAAIWDEARIFSSPMILKEGVQAPKISSNYQTVKIKNDDLKTIYNYD